MIFETQTAARRKVQLQEGEGGTEGKEGGSRRNRVPELQGFSDFQPPPPQEEEAQVRSRSQIPLQNQLQQSQD